MKETNPEHEQAAVTAGTAEPAEAAESRTGALIPAEISLQAVFEVARAIHQVHTLEALDRLTVKAGNCRIGLRRAVRSLAQICCDPRRIAALMLHAADNPDWAWVNFWAVFCPEMTLRQMAKLRHTNVSTVKFYLSQTELPSDVYDFVRENH